jgi:serine phosphatase RsbU (regulator of sigma subunit)
VLVTGDGDVVLSVGAVAGRDAHGAAVMGPVRGVLRAYALEDPEPAAILSRLNRFLTHERRDDGYVTAVVAHYRPADHRLCVANAAHPLPMLVTADDPDGAVSRVSRLAAVGPALGVLARPEFVVQRMTLGVGAALCAFTDGLTDRHGDPAPGDDLRLPRALARAWHLVADEPRHPTPPARRILDHLRAELLGTADPDDDACVAVLRRAR